MAFDPADFIWVKLAVIPVHGRGGVGAAKVIDFCPAGLQGVLGQKVTGLLQPALKIQGGRGSI